MFRTSQRIFDAILDMIPSAEVIEPLHSRARIAREVLKVLKDRLDDPPSITELCVAVGGQGAHASFELCRGFRPAAGSFARRTAAKRSPSRAITAG